MLVEQDDLEKESKPKKIDPIRLRQGKRQCPRCHHEMPYRRVSVKTAQWSPGLYAWFCDTCPSVMVLDGTIMPEETAWANQDKERRDKRMKQSLGALFKKW